MVLLDVLAAALVFGAAGAFALGARALEGANDIEALYFLVVGIFALRAGIQIGRPGASA